MSRPALRDLGNDGMISEIEKEACMRDVPVVYQDGMMDMVEPNVLQRLIESDEIVKFQRSDGWVYPGIDPIRRYVESAYAGPERRLLENL